MTPYPVLPRGQRNDVAPWDEGYDADLLYAEFSHPSGGMDVAVMAAALADAPADGYEGVTDDNGDSHRAASIEDLMAGLGLVPYFTNPEDVLAFLHVGDEMMGEFSEYADIISDYQSETGKLFYIIADLIIYTEDDIAAEDYVPLYNALTGSDMTMEEIRRIRAVKADPCTGMSP